MIWVRHPAAQYYVRLSQKPDKHAHHYIAAYGSLHPNGERGQKRVCDYPLARKVVRQYQFTTEHYRCHIDTNNAGTHPHEHAENTLSRYPHLDRNTYQHLYADTDTNCNPDTGAHSHTGYPNADTHF